MILNEEIIQPSQQVKVQEKEIRRLKKENNYCKILHVTRQGFYKYLANKDRPWKYQKLANVMLDIHSEDEYNDTYGRVRMHQALILRHPEGINIPSERTIYRVMEKIGLSHRPNHKPHGITKAD